MTPDEFAAQQATAWKEGLAGWGYGPEQITKLRGDVRLHDLHARARSRAWR